MDGPTKRCPEATSVHKFGCIFTCVAMSFVWLQVSMYGRKHTSYRALCSTVHVWTVRPYKKYFCGCFFGTDGHLVVILFRVQPHINRLQHG